MDAKTERTCGTCTACCKTHAILELNKPRGKWCAHCTIGKGCKIYGEHPPTCKDFACAWLEGLDSAEDRPDRVKIVVDSQEVLHIGRVIKIFEVSEGALEASYARQLTRRYLLTSTPVVHIPLRGPGKFFLAKDQEATPGFTFDVDGDPCEIVPFVSTGKELVFRF
jgi:hypothetical protein